MVQIGTYACSYTIIVNNEDGGCVGYKLQLSKG